MTPDKAKARLARGDALRARAFVLRMAPLFGVATLRVSIAIARRSA